MWPYAIPLDKVTEMRTSRKPGTRLFTADPAYPEPLMARQPDEFVDALKRRLAHGAA